MLRKRRSPPRLLLLQREGSKMSAADWCRDTARIVCRLGEPSSSARPSFTRPFPRLWRRRAAVDLAGRSLPVVLRSRNGVVVLVLRSRNALSCCPSFSGRATASSWCPPCPFPSACVAIRPRSEEDETSGVPAGGWCSECQKYSHFKLSHFKFHVFFFSQIGRTTNNRQQRSSAAAASSRARVQTTRCWLGGGADAPPVVLVLLYSTR